MTVWVEAGWKGGRRAAITTEKRDIVTWQPTVDMTCNLFTENNDNG